MRTEKEFQLMRLVALLMKDRGKSFTFTEKEFFGVDGWDEVLCIQENVDYTMTVSLGCASVPE